MGLDLVEKCTELVHFSFVAAEDVRRPKQTPRRAVKVEISKPVDDGRIPPIGLTRLSEGDVLEVWFNYHEMIMGIA